MFFTSSKPSSKELYAKLNALDKSQAVIEFDTNGYILTANKNFLDAMGYTLGEIQGKHHGLFVDPVYAQSQEYKTFWEKLKSGEYQAAQYKRLGKGGKEIWIQASYNPIVDSSGRAFKVVKYATDITKEIMETSDLKGQIDAIGKAQAVIHFDVQGNILWANQNFLEVMGYTLNEIQGNHHSMFAPTGYAETQEYKNFWESLRAGKFSTGEYKRLAKGAKEVWIHASYNPIFDPSGRVFKVVKFATDITAQVNKRSESEKIGNIVDQNLGKIVVSVDDASRQSGTAASAATQAASTVSTIASGAEELNSSIREIAQSMARSKTSVEQVINLADEADRSTHTLTKAAEQMSGIVSLIQDIANQINLLALNATIESARAGDVGKGFAVVASEVKSLAGQVAQATDKITGEIGNMQLISGDVVKVLENIKRSVSEVQTSVTGVASAIEEQSAVTMEISSNMQTASIAVQEVDTSLRDILSSMEISNQLAREGQEMYKTLRAV